MEDKDRIEEGIELDKLRVPTRTKASAKAPRSAEKHYKDKVLGKTKATLRNILAFVSREKIFVCAFLAGLVVVSAILYLFLTKSSSDGVASGDSYVGSIVYVVSSSIAKQHYVRFKLSIPFKDNKEKADLMQKLPTIKHELSISGSHSDVAQSIEQKDLKILKKHILKIVNDLTGVPIEELRLEELTLNRMAGRAISDTS